MAIQTIGIGTVADDGTGDSLRVAGDKINDNFNEIYTTLGDGSTLNTGVTAVNNATANELVTIGATTTELDAEANLTFDGSTLSFANSGTNYLTISNSSNDAVITSGVQDKDILFKGDDGGSAITALTPKSLVPFAAQSLEEPVPYSLPPITTKSVPLFLYSTTAS